MTATRQIPASVRDTFQRIPVIDEHRQLFDQPTRPLLEHGTDPHVDAIRCVGDDAVSAIEPHLAYRFMMEAQLEALEDVFLQLGDRHPERFRETERGLALVRNLEILLNGAQPRVCGPEGA